MTTCRLAILTLALNLLLGGAAQADMLRQQLPVTFGAGLNHPLALNEWRAGAIVASGDADLIGIELQGERFWRELSTSTLKFYVSGLGSVRAVNVDAGPGDETVSDFQGGARLSLPIPDIKGLWTGFQLMGNYRRTDDDSDSDIFGVLSLRYQASAASLGRDWDFYTSTAIGQDRGPGDYGLLLGAATRLPRNRVLGVELATEDDSLTAYASFAMRTATTLTASLGLADNVDLIAQVQLSFYLN